MRASDNPRVRALAVKRRVEPSHVAAAGLLHAAERRVPILRRPVHRPRPLTSRPATREEPPRDRRRSGRIGPWPGMRVCPRTTKPTPRPVPGQGQPCATVWRPLTAAYSQSGSCWMRGIGARLCYVPDENAYALAVRGGERAALRPFPRSLSAQVGRSSPCERGMPTEGQRGGVAPSGGEPQSRR